MGRVAYFVSPHGFGHAARACAVMVEMVKLLPDTHFEIFTTVPKWFFSESLGRGFTYHDLAADVGMVQCTPLNEDLAATVDRLDDAVDEKARVGLLVETLVGKNCSLVIADISPLGLEVAAAADIPSVLIENFTWDWIYLSYPSAPNRLRQHGRRMAGIFAAVDLRIQTEPICRLLGTAVQVPPVARSPAVDRFTTRQRLGVPGADTMIVVSMGGIPWDYGSFSDFEHSDGPWIVIPGGSDGGIQRRGRMLLLPFHADVFHPDLVAAADLVVSKLGYSTVAETYLAGASLAYLARPRFPESPVLARWVEECMNAVEIGEEDLQEGSWLDKVEGLLSGVRRKPKEEDGARQAAEIILNRFEAVIG